MEWNFDIEHTINHPLGNGVVLLDGQSDKYSQRDFDNLCNLLDKIGLLSAEAQELKGIITTGMKFFGTDQRIYMKCSGNIFKGFIKVGERHLFIYDEYGQINEMNPLCVLDFYTYEMCQRQGIGRDVYMAMIKNEKVEPRKLAYDKPSFKFLSFLKKYFGLENYVPQNNNFVVFDDYFKNNIENEPSSQSNELNNNFNNNNQYINNNNYNNNFGNNINNIPNYNNYNEVNSNYNNNPHNFNNYANNYGNNNYNANNNNNQYGNYNNNYNMNYQYNHNEDHFGHNYDNNFANYGNQLVQNYQNNNNYQNENAHYKQQEGQKIDYNDYKFLDKFQVPQNPYQFSKTSSEYGSFLNYK